MKHFAVLSILLAAVTLQAEDAPMDYKITTRKNDDTVEVRADKDKTVFVIKSPSGIGQATIERVRTDWPKEVVLRLHLKGLESFRVSNGVTTLGAAVSVSDAKPKTRLWKDGNEDVLLDEKSPFWMDIRFAGGEGPIEMTLPRRLFVDKPTTITLNWIDFYRN